MNGPLPARHQATALSPAALTARTSMPSTCSPGILKETPRLEKSVCAAERVPQGRPQPRHVEAFIDRALVRRAIAEIGYANKIVTAIAVGERQAGAERDL